MMPVSWKSLERNYTFALPSIKVQERKANEEVKDVLRICHLSMV